MAKVDDSRAREQKLPVWWEGWREAFILSLGNWTKASKSAGITRQAAYKLSKENETFAAAVEEAEAEARDSLRETIRARALDEKFGAQILLALAKARLPEFRESSRLELTGANGAPLAVTISEAVIPSPARSAD